MSSDISFPNVSSKLKHKYEDIIDKIPKINDTCLINAETEGTSNAPNLDNKYKNPITVDLIVVGNISGLYI
jgi:hypothetical protein